MRKTILSVAMLLGMFSCQDSEEIILMVYKETYCADPWNTKSTDKSDEEIVIEYLLNRQIMLFDMGIVEEEPAETCNACHCLSGRSIYISILSEQQENAEKIGFREVEN